MKSYTKKVITALLAAMLTVSAVATFGTSAAQTDDAVGAVAQQHVGDGEDVTEPATTEPVVTEPATEPATQPAVEVGSVKNVQKVSFENNYITLTWDKVNGASGYYVYICNADETTVFSKLAQVTATTFTAKNLKHTTQYHFRVSAFIVKDGKTYEGPQTTKKTATQPGKLTGLGKVRSSDVIEMSWSRNSKATGYRVYRTSAESGNKEVLIKNIYGNSNTKFVDTNVVKGRIYKYKVKSFRDLYDTTYNGISQTTTFMAGLCAPNYSIVSRCQRVNLTWKKNAYATSYDIYYSDQEANSTFTKLANTTKLFYNTKKLSNNKKYYFRVYPVYKSGSTTVSGTGHKKSVTCVNKAYGSSTGSTYVEISIEQQHMWFYKNGKLVVETDVVTGNKGSNDTPKGFHHIYSKARNTYLNGPGYSSFVNYWMAFSGGCGIHDASWRSSYGGTIYKGNGSHGCVNTPKGAVSKIYSNASTGTPVIVY